ncbi:penicillin-binding protein 1A [Novosphingobium sp. JCM 18896]|uniref:penicillin-binding protein 1A n=1 Tax=Novosphingobium sp. JCM 18896 TaxID=2989731 RepID=UPI002222C45F|nr:transglycosylase domain-containing protein [Novosphingobium sp. JCM 18896]MCW1428169.1 transglycosylase domain-containing protein [Novosphingobium sp. JCM 18896]
MAENASSDGENLNYRIRREASGAWGWLRSNWREKRWVRWLGYAGGGFLAVFAAAWLLVARDLPSADKLLDYQPPLPTIVRGIDGQIVYSYARERRVQLRFVDFPKQLTDSFLAAEDKTFWTHGGVDYPGLIGAVIDYASKMGSGQRAKGGSTITQQVAKNILIGDEYSVTRKLKEMILARRIEATLTKQQILELYLNEIPLGRQSFGVQAAARAYFGKDVGDLNLQESAFLAILPKAPERYGRAKNADMAIARRNYVLDQMEKNGWASAEAVAQAKTQPLGIIGRRVETYDPSVGYFVEEVRRQLIDRYGEKAEKGPNGVYAGGLWVRTSVDPEMQKAAQDSLRAGLLRYHGGMGWRGPIEHLDIDGDRWQTELVTLNKTITYQDWRVGIVIDRQGASASIGFPDGKTGRLTGLPDALRAGDVIAAAPVGTDTYAVKTIPEVSGGMLVESPADGRIVAMQGGFDAGLASFNRATQALRQPGSTIKPFVYATGLDMGMTPATMVSDGTFCVYQGTAGQKCFRNFGGGGGGGTHTMRWGLEQSRNLMTVHIANDAGMENVTKTFQRVGIGKYQNYLSFALGAGDTTVIQMVNAYAALAANGVQYPASVIDYVQDRNGKVIFRADNRRCTTCNMAQWDGKPMPRFEPRGKQVLDPRTAYQVVHMLEGVVQRGTAVVLRDLKIPLFGKTGTTTGPTNVWFVGGSQKYVAGVYLGYDKPRSLGGYAQGGRIAAPIFKQFVQATRNRWSDLPFVAPEGVRMVRIDRTSGKRVFGVEPGSDPKAGVIWEAFKPDTEPARATRADELSKQRSALLAAIQRGRQARQQDARDAARSAESADFAEEQGGVY